MKEEFRTLHQVLLTFLKWRHCSPSTYSDTYCSLSLPQILAPFVRIQLLEWHPLLRASTFDQFPFFTQLFTFHEVSCLPMAAPAWYCHLTCALPWPGPASARVRGPGCD